ncbi:MAG: hypothetical protein ABL967_13225 [Bryobacteraceae bacterium]
MLGLLDKNPESKPAEQSPESGPAEGTPAAANAGEESEFELVVGRRQIASWLFLVTLLLGTASTVAFLAGKMTAPASAKSAEVPAKPVTSTPAPVASVAPPIAEPANPGAVAVQVPLPEASILNAPFSATKKPSNGPEPPIFQEPKAGGVYLQMGAVERGMAVIFVEGLRKHGFDASAATGPNERIFRVLIGPLENPQAFTRAKMEVDAIGLGTFARKFQQ